MHRDAPVNRYTPSSAAETEYLTIQMLNIEEKKCVCETGRVPWSISLSNRKHNFRKFIGLTDIKKNPRVMALVTLVTYGIPALFQYKDAFLQV